MRIIKNGEILEGKSLMCDIDTFSANIVARQIKCVEIYLSSSYDFMVALFGAINAGVKAYILPKEAHLGFGVLINDNNFAEFMGDLGESKGE